MSKSAVICGSDAILSQLGSFISGLEPSVYTRDSEVVKGGTLGKHVRHILDHFQGAICTPSGEVIDYDHRDRGTAVETEASAANEQIGSLRSAMNAFDAEALAEPVTTRVMCSSDGVCEELGSTRAREIFFAMHHAIHHNAMIKSIAREFGVELPHDFGTAPSTLNFEKTSAAS